MALSLPSPCSQRQPAPSRQLRMPAESTRFNSLNRLCCRVSAMQNGEAAQHSVAKLAFRQWSVENLAKSLFPERNGLVGPRKERALAGGLAAINAITGAAWLLERDTAHGGPSSFLDFGFVF